MRQKSPHSILGFTLFAWIASTKGQQVQSTVEVWEAVSGKLLTQYQSASSIASVTWSPDSRLVASGEANFTVADLTGALFTHTVLTGANLTKACIDETHFTDIDLREVKGLETIQQT
jgi:uncharacterized protein YjbI with pentapeptide repeats